MKKTLTLLALTFSAQAHAATQDDFCLVAGKYAARVAEARDIGMTEKELTDTIQTPNLRQPFSNIISFVYTMGMDPATARRLVYLKCTSQGFGTPSGSGK